MRKLLLKFVCVMFALSVVMCSAFAASAAEYSLGDVDGDNNISVKDATKMQMYLAGLATLDSAAQYAADVNQNGTVDINDVTCVQKYVARIITSFDSAAATTAESSTEEVITEESTTLSDYDSDGYNNIVVKP